MFSIAVAGLLGVAFAAVVYLRRERLGAAGVGLTALRTIAFGALIVAFFNPTRDVRQSGGPTTVLLDASLSMGAAGSHWKQALDSARSYKGSNARSTILRFGTSVLPFDSGLPDAGATGLANALRAAAGHEGSAVVVTDGEVDDWATVPPELARGVTLVTLPRDSVRDIALLGVSIPDVVQRTDSVRVALSIGTWANRDTAAVLEVFSGATRLLRAPLRIATGTGNAERSVALAAKALPLGTSTLRFALTTSDDEPRDDARVRVITVVETPAIVAIADPADPEGRFLFSGLASVAPGRVRGFARLAPDRWVDMSSMTPIRTQDVASAARQAALVVVRGQYQIGGATGARWTWAAGSGTSSVLAGDWYAAAAPASPLAAHLSAADWDSLPPMTALLPVEAGAKGWVALTARQGRGGVERAVVIGEDSGGVRRMTTAGLGLWRWSLRGGAPREAYRALLAAGVDWLLARPEGSAAKLTASTVVARALPIAFQWNGAGAPDSIAVTFTGDSSTVRRTLRMQNGAAQAMLPPGTWRWQAPSANASGVSVVEAYSDEFHPRPVAVTHAVGLAGFILVGEQARERWWLFALAMGALVAEWVWRQRRGLP